MKKSIVQRVKARVNKQGLMCSATRIERPMRGKAAYRRRTKHQRSWNLDR